MEISNTLSSNYLDTVQKATRKNTVQELSNSVQSGKPVNIDEVQSSNQQIRDTARETGMFLYSQKLAVQTIDTYANVNSQSNVTSTTQNSTENFSTNDIYNFDPAKVNDVLQTGQRRAFAISLYENVNQQTKQPEVVTPPADRPSTQPINISI